jgi:hypothetical protein
LKNHPARDQQFRDNAQARLLFRARQPVISVDTKQKDLVGNCKNNGRE